jgi:hypothetical protein
MIMNNLRHEMHVTLTNLYHVHLVLQGTAGKGGGAPALGALGLMHGAGMEALGGGDVAPTLEGLRYA